MNIYRKYVGENNFGAIQKINKSLNILVVRFKTNQSQDKICQYIKSITIQHKYLNNLNKIDKFLN